MLFRLFKNGPLSALAQLPSRTIVNVPHKLQSPFYKPLLNDLSLPRVPRQHPRQSKWDDPDYIYPMPTMKPTQKTGRALIEELQQEERQRLDRRKSQIPDIRSGDVVRFGYYRSIAGKKVLHLEGLVVQTAKKKSLNASCRVLMNYHLCEVEMKLKLYSPLVAYVRIGKYGSGRLRKKLGYIMKGGIKPSLTHEPIIKKNDHTKRIPKDHGKGPKPASEEPEAVQNVEA